MNRKKRLILLILLAISFLILGPSIVLYSQGYRFNFQERKIVKTGGIYFIVSPRGVNITIKHPDSNTIIRRTTDFFSNVAYIENLLPRTYNIIISKEGYHNWYKSLDIREKFVTDLKNITLMPQNPSFNILKRSISDFFPLEGRNDLLIKRISEENKLTLHLYNMRSGIETMIFSSENESLDYFINHRLSDKLIIKTKENTYLVDINKPEEVLPLNLPDGATNLFIYPREKNKIVFLKNGSIFFYDTELQELGSLVSDVLTYKINDNGDLFWISNKGYFYSNIINPQRISQISFNIKENKNYEIFSPNSSKLMIRENNIFYLLDRDNREFRKIFSSPYIPIKSPDLKKIVHHTDHEIEVFFLEEENDQPRRKQGENIFLTRFARKISNLNWITSHYLLFNIDSEIKVIEIDNRNNINIVNLANFKDPKIFFNYIDKRIYLLSEGNLWSSERIIQ